ncbi:N-terminal nucleophile aminohydrolase [Rozella allomycis CSF55]|uniref:Proteasome subunit beta n=1 Tax=Rozella allomycis (strain CSF55) TaxID=988480 RepID=A0A075APF7_ROZAC|nr:Proteasome, beta-type subunit domain-containing protein [Rozella allomycis CSF55]RKP22018.1 N-terminal nucleophile aminohydrolase [Rozella allomycis CSF55]|eukprot:EPZ31979.1 Proteasome, beta-type subunit domain-containing protein [Rozella allomycis CSF55]
MEALFGIVGKDFVLIAADKSQVRSIVVMKTDQDKTRNLNDNIVMACAGEPGDTSSFGEFIQANVQLYSTRNGYNMSTKETAHFTRSSIAKSLRSRNPYQVNMIIAGYHPRDGPELYWIDYMGTMQKLPFAGHGYSAYFNLSLLDRHYKANMSLEEASSVLGMCFQELKTRFMVNLPEFTVKVIDKDGIREHKIQ